MRTEATTPLKLALRRPSKKSKKSKKGGRLTKDVEAMRAGLMPLPPPGAPIKVRTKGGREAIVLERMQRGWFRVVLDGNANEEGGANERKSLRYFAPGQEHLLNAAPKAAPKPKAKVPAQVLARTAPMKTCPACSVRAYNRSTTCPGCGATFPKKAKKGDAAEVQVGRSTSPLFADGDRVTVLINSGNNHGGRSGEIVGRNGAWWNVMLDGDDEEICSIRGKDLKRSAPAPTPAPAAAAPPPPPPPAVAPPPAAAPPAAAPPPPPPPPQPGFFLTNTSASLIRWFRFRFPGSAEAGDKFEGLVNRWAMLPEDILNMDVEDCKRMLREEGFETAVVGMLQMRLRSACRAWMQGAAPAMPGAW